ncbi:MAG: hypothetical protein HYV07_18080 [Deltaproteobacteria bacterium]|nr:hypothetical protein [Deltaproteobacteria bacterium]
MNELVALKSGEGEVVLSSPKLGIFRSTLRERDVLRAGQPLGTLTILGRHFTIVAPEGVFGRVQPKVPAGVMPLGYGDPIALVSALEGVEEPREAKALVKEHEGEVAIRAPIHGVFYARPSPEAPAFVKVGDVLGSGQTVGLIEVMKTFHPVTHQGERVEVVAVPAADRSEVTRGAVLVWAQEITR